MDGRPGSNAGEISRGYGGWKRERDQDKDLRGVAAGCEGIRGAGGKGRGALRGENLVAVYTRSGSMKSMKPYGAGHAFIR